MTAGIFSGKSRHFGAWRLTRLRPFYIGVDTDHEEDFEKSNRKRCEMRKVRVI
jgi:hypothetical protein